MTRDEIIKLAHEAGIHVYPEFEAAFESFFQAAHAAGTAAEREACAKVAERWPVMEYTAHGIALAIRARGQE